ncbi:MAG: hypothetical protein RMJ98_20990 [Myxococcales bacterium]|nr:hypothetical protein [Polyangiaceae bacterium]MDW8251780.1 hypothetical protein [Myxococcales bacterium]
MTCSSRNVRLGVGLVGLGLALGGCNPSEAAQNRTTTSGAAAGALSARVETETYVAYLRPVGDYKKDVEGVVEVVLETKGEFHTNEQYPYKFTPKESDGVKFSKEKFGREDGTFEASKAVIKVAFTPWKSGQVSVGGKFALSVCSDKNCLMDKKDLALDVMVK